ncbi:Bis(5'-nucleosyl)-tetraphosphatase (asymmetrical) [Thermoanaerobacterium xylanolyticum LX-11]|uniref:Bis(5'-nucleosyl)-tetraphosphatase (Asymmetrical) n=1 Tax=Thermoanaerobacterium xylanolyticum (strain ATCC 49914 / DSM 7097 / LX-11) TaxID=858215 RepID=F6BIA2_THEXL|nr:bis(5'-nucleosyl)-tetraphosphatase PrpE [Thermoanaerobacterium xylanolyticum]AEF16710.1 Bis(5'-nucleosyl)-tetraphosphatase (asymmetrical) [Thermoanaerobacterium xylanolyticum LX-11]
MTAYDVIGDVHGCYKELTELIDLLGYTLKDGVCFHKDDRKLVFLGDITDRGPNSVDVIELVYRNVKAKKALYTPGNHCNKLYRYLLGHNVKIIHGLETTVAELNGLSEKQKRIVASHFKELYETAPMYLVLDDGKLVVAHAGIKEKYIGFYGKYVRQFVLYGDITGEKNPDGTPVRLDWAKDYKGKPIVVYGHTPVKEPRFLNNTVNIDTGCVFGGKLSALRYPEMKVYSVKSSMSYDESRFRDL